MTIAVEIRKRLETEPEYMTIPRGELLDWAEAIAKKETLLDFIDTALRCGMRTPELREAIKIYKTVHGLT
jgi:hypothetical protein